MTHCTEEVLADRRTLPAGDIAGRRERLLVGLFCLLAAVRVFVFTAAYPFFNNVDEQCHFDLVCRYSHGDAPKGTDPFSAEAAAFMAIYHSPEYCWRLQDYPGMKTPPPPWCLSAEEQAKTLAELTDGFRHKVNYEAVHMPFYYTVVGVWYNLGKLLGMEGGNLLYWTRFFNIPVYMLLVWLAYLLSKELFAASKFVYLGVPFLLVFFPQDIFYAIHNVVLSAPLVTLSLYLLLRMYRTEAPRPGLAGAGLAAAAAVLTKVTNLPILVVVGIVAFLKLVPSWWQKRPLTQFVPVVLLVLASSVPVGCWLARNYLVLGDLTGFALESRCLTWTPKPVGQYWNHPIFTPGGFLLFWSRLMTTLWRGEMRWHFTELAAGSMDAFYLLSSTVFLWRLPSPAFPAENAVASPAGRLCSACFCSHLR